MVAVPQDHLMNPYEATEERTVKVLSDDVVKDPSAESTPTSVPEYVQSQEISSQESITNDPNELSRTENNTNAAAANSAESQRQSVSSQSSITSISSTTISSSHAHEADEPSYVSDLIKRAKAYVNSDQIEAGEHSKSLVGELITSLNKARAEAGQFKIKAELLSISSKDADMRYEVENELIKRQVERLKSQGENMDMLMNKINHQKMTLKKYKNEIINKNKEIIRLRSKQHSNNDSKKRRKSNSVPGGMLDTLGLLASQVLTEEEKQTVGTESHHHHNHHHPQHSQSFPMPKLNSFKHRSEPADDTNNDTISREYSVN